MSNPDSVEAIQARYAKQSDHNLAVHAEAKRTRGRPRLTEGEHPVSIKINLPKDQRDAIDEIRPKVKRSTFAREAIAEKLARDAEADSR